MMNRRRFLQGCCAGIVAMNGARLGSLSFAQTPSGGRDMLVTIFLRGGMDALSFLVPHGDSYYQEERSGGLALGAGQVLDIDGYFGLHPQAAALMELYQQGHLALIPATGIPDAHGTRSHFQAQDYLEYGGFTASQGGWLGRYLAETQPSEQQLAGLFRGMSLGSALALSLQGYNGALAMNDIGEFTLRGDAGQSNELRRALRLMYAQDQELQATAAQTLDAVDLLDANPPGEYTPRQGVEYPDNDFSGALAMLAQLIKMDIGFQAGTVDLGGWDTHENQANGNNPTAGSFADRVGELAGGLAAFWNDMTDFHGRITVVVMSEFGRRLKQNSNNGTDHGHGGLMMVLSASLRGRQIWGAWPGLSPEELYERKDLRVTTDWRQVLAEVAFARLGMDAAAMQGLLPGYQYPGPVGFFLETQDLPNHLIIR